MCIYLYVKTHNKTGLKYLGKTTKDPFKYKGSGKRWLRHLSKHGNDVTTEIIKECQTLDEIKEWGLYYSNYWKVVENKNWANMIPETGSGTYSGFSQSRINAVSLALRGVPKSPEHREKLSGKKGPNKARGKPNKNKARIIKDDQKQSVSLALLNIPKSTDHKNKISETLSIRCSCTICQADIAVYRLNNHYKKFH